MIYLDCFCSSKQTNRNPDGQKRLPLFLVSIFLLHVSIVPPSVSAAASPHFYHNIQNEFIERGCHNKLVGILIGRSGYITSRNFAISAINSIVSVVEGGGSSGVGLSRNITYPNNEYCQWMIKATPESRIRVRFTHFDVESGKHCAYDNVTVWQIATSTASSSGSSNLIASSGVSNGVATNSPNRRLLGTFCGSNIPPTIETNVANSLLVVFQSDSSLARSGFRLVWEAFTTDDPLEQACIHDEPAVLQGAQGIIQLTHFDGKTPYNPNMLCAWKIQIPAGKLIRLFFEHFDVESSKECAFDSVEVFDGGMPLTTTRIGKFCGENSQPFVLTSSRNEMLVVFKSDNSTEKSGFQLKWHEVTLIGYVEMGCYQTRPALIRGRSSGSLHLPGYNGAVFYEPNMNCKWFISVANSSTIRLKLTALSIEPEPKSCMFDYLLISHPTNKLEPIVFCGYEAPSEIIHWKSSELLVEFRSDENVQSTGFHLDWFETTTSSSANEPEWPEKLGFNEDGKIINNSGSSTPLSSSAATHPPRMVITAAPRDENVVRKTTERRNMQAEMSANLVTRHNSNIIHQSSHAGFNGLDGTQNVLSEGPNVVVPERSLPQQPLQYSPPGLPDMKKSATATYFCQSPRRYYYSRTGKLSSPGFGSAEYPHDSHCSYVITVPEGYFVHLNFTDFEIEYSNNCEKDYVAIYEGESELNKSLAKLCGFQSPGKSLQSFTNRILVVFHSNNHTHFKGFSAQFTAVQQPNYAEAGCWWGEENPAEISASSGVLTSRNFDGATPYLYNQQCAWHLFTNASFRISIHFSHFSLEASDKGCAGDTLAIYDGADKSSPILGIFCGIAVPPPVLSSGRDLFLIFRTDDRMQRTGFRLEWNSVPASHSPGMMPNNLPETSINQSDDNSTRRDNSSDGKVAPHAIVQATWPGAGPDSAGGLPRGYMLAPDHPPSAHLVASANSNGHHQHINQPSSYRQSPEMVGPPLRQHTPMIPAGVRRIMSAENNQLFPPPMMSPHSVHSNSNNNNGAVSQPVVQRMLPNVGAREAELLSSKRIQFSGRAAVSNNNRASNFQPSPSRAGDQAFGRPASPSYENNHAPVTEIPFDKPSDIENQHNFQHETSQNSEVLPTSSTTTTPLPHVVDECLARPEHTYGGVPSSYYGSCDDGRLQVLTTNAVTPTGGVITSGNFDRIRTYPMLQNCVWSIRLPPGFRISVSMLYFDLERGRDDVCPYDRLEFWDGAVIPEDNSEKSKDRGTSPKTNNASQEMGEFCGFHPRKNPIVSSSSSLTIRFVSDAVVQRTGFCLKWLALPVESELLVAEEVGGRRSDSNNAFGTGGDASASEQSGCGGPKYMMQGSGHIKSPNYGTSAYAPRLDCRWVVAAPPGKIVRVNLIDVDIEPDVSCRYDFLALYDGASEYATVIKRLCGRPRPQILRSTSNTVYLQFRSDGTAEGRGFLIEYSFTDPPT